MVSELRAQRIADRIYQELSELLLFATQDPRLSGVSVTDVTIDRELTAANIYVSAIEGSARTSEILAGLNHACGFLRSELAKKIKLRTFPHLRFHWDPTPEHADHMERLFARLQEEANQHRTSVEDAEHQDDKPE